MDKLTILDDDFGIKVKKKLLDIKMSQTELADIAGVSKGYMSEVLSEKKGSLNIKIKIIKAINAEENRRVFTDKAVAESGCTANGN